MKKMFIVGMVVWIGFVLQVSSPLAADTVFQEKFESGWGNWWADGGLWEIGSPTVGPESSHGGTSCAGTVLDGTYPPYTDSRLISPSITLPAISGKEEIHLRFWHWFSYSSNDGGTVQISVYDRQIGDWSAWEIISNNFVSSSAVWSVMDIDLTKYANEKIKIAFFHFAQPYHENHGWYIDDILIIKNNPAFTTGDFESGWGDWSTDHGIWEIGTPGAGPEICFSGTSCAGTVLNGTYPPYTDSRLITPPITLTSNVNEEIHLRFWHWFSYSSNDGGTVQISVYDRQIGDWSAWEVISNNFVSSSAVWSIMDIDLTKYANEKIKIAFFHFAQPYHENHGWYIDDVTISGIEQPPATWYLDSDGDGYGDSGVSISSDDPPAGYVSDNTDCDDTDPGIHPGAVETGGDWIDQDCDGYDGTIPFSGRLTADNAGGVVPVTIAFYTLISRGASPFTYDYDFGDGTRKTSGTKTESHTYQDTGFYTVTVTVTDNQGTVHNLSTTIEVVDEDGLTAYQSELANNAEQVKQAPDSTNLLSIFNTVQTIIDKSLTSINNADDTLKKSVEDGVQSEGGLFISNTREQLMNLIQAGKVQKTDVENLSKGVSGVVSNMVKNSVPVQADNLSDLKTISKDFYDLTIDTLVETENLTPDEIEEIRTDKAKSRTFFSNKTYLMDDVTETAGIAVDVTTDFTPEEMAAFAEKHNLTEAQSAALFHAVESTPDVNQTIALDTVSTKTIADIAVMIFNAYSGKTVQTSLIDSVAGNILLQFTDNTHISFLAKNIAIIDDTLPKGLFDMPDGTKLGVTDSYALTFVSYPVFPHDFAAQLLKIGLDPVVGQDGTVDMPLQNDLTLHTRIGWGYFQDNAFHRMTTSFSITGGSDPAAKAYSLVVTYDTGLSQLMPPAVTALKSLTAMLDAIAPDGYRVDTNTGVITIGALKLKPDYLFRSLEQIDYPAISSRGGLVHDKMAFVIQDVNGDGLDDILYYSDRPRGSQILYSLAD